MQNPHPTRYAELNGVLHDLVAGAQEALGDSFVGAYVHGSFALGAGDLHSDCDFLVVVTERPDVARETALRDLHRRSPTATGTGAATSRARTPSPATCAPWRGSARSGSTSTTAGTR